MNDAKIFQLLGRIFTFMSKNLFCFCLILVASYFLYRLASNGFLYGADTSNKVAGIFTPLIVGGVTAYVAWNQYKLAQRQHELAREQKSLTERQANIAEQQAQTAKENMEVAHNKLRMEQFDKRYEVFGIILKHFSVAFNTSLNISNYLNMNAADFDNMSKLEKIKPEEQVEKKNEFMLPIFDRAMEKVNEIIVYNDNAKIDREVELVKIKFLFNENIYKCILEISKETHSLLNMKCKNIKGNLVVFSNNYVYNKKDNSNGDEEIRQKITMLTNKIHYELEPLVQPFFRVPE